LYGRGIFSGIQKYKYLPEPAGDSIFATFAEETGFVFSVFLIVVFFGVFVFVLFLAKNIKNIFEKYVLLGISSHMIFQAILNIGSMIGLVPLSGDILPFFSQGGTSLIINLVELSIVLNFTKIQDDELLS
jgi:cell division protein FtsW (lipid II flippase)